ncbi:ATP-binding protein [Lentibacillus halophilus]|uniref:ATP-binding protein n=1 Tax=Lentibacillus halophilus TaxID=295065 RepID=A0ABP3J2B2_9BACI
MKQRLLNVTIQTKIAGIVIGIVLMIIVLLLSVVTYTEINQLYANKNRLSLQTAKTVSFVPAVNEAVHNHNSERLEALTQQLDVRHQADFIVIQNRKGVILSHPDEAEVGNHLPFNDGYKAAVFGGYYNIDSDELLGPAVTGKAPIMTEAGDVLGVVTVGYLKKNINNVVFDRLKRNIYLSLLAVLIGFIASFLLARHIRKDTLGLEPREISTLYRDRAAILSSINEGVIATDKDGKITLINETAKHLLRLNERNVNQTIDQVLTHVHPDRLTDQAPIVNKEMHINERTIIVNLAPIRKEGAYMGTVMTFRDKTDVTEMLDTLSEVKRYSDDLRAQTHEFSNKLYVISGLIQLEKYDEALEMIRDEVSDDQQTNKLIFDQIQDAKVQAVLLGKMNKASEKKIDFQVDEGSQLDRLPEHIKSSDIITIIGNLIDNAFDEVLKQTNRYVMFSALDIGHDIIFEVSDNGSGIKDDAIPDVFTRSYSTKAEDDDAHRGYGLYNVKQAVDALHGSIEMDSNEHGMTITVYIPKERRGGRSDD